MQRCPSADVGLMHCRNANMTNSEPEFAYVAKQIGRLVHLLDSKLAETALSKRQKAWVCFSILSAYECRRACIQQVGDLKELQQVKSPCLASEGAHLCPSCSVCIFAILYSCLCSCFGQASRHHKFGPSCILDSQGCDWSRFDTFLFLRAVAETYYFLVRAYDTV